MDGQHRRWAYESAGNTLKKLIQAVANAASGASSGELPPELQLYWMCRRYEALPEAGALMEQDAGLLSRMAILANVYDTIQRVRGLVGDDIHRMRPDDGRLLTWLDAIEVRY